MGRRWHPLREEWVIVAAHRQDRPWSGSTLQKGAPVVAAVRRGLLSLPGNARVSGAVNPQYGQTYVFGNDHPCVSLTAPSDLQTPAGLYQNRSARDRRRDRTRSTWPTPVWKSAVLRRSIHLDRRPSVRARTF